MGWASWAEVVESNGGLSDQAEREITGGAHKERDTLANISDDLEFFSGDHD